MPHYTSDMRADKLNRIRKHRHALRFSSGALVCVWAAGIAAGATLPPAEPAPDVSELDQAYLVRVVRRAIAAAWTDQPAYSPGYVPETLESTFCRASVTLRRSGRLVGIGASPRRKGVEACLAAGRAAAADPRTKPDRTLEGLRKCTISIELIGEFQTLDTVLGDDGAIRAAVEPGVHGIGVKVGERELCLTPGDMISYGFMGLKGSLTTRRHPVYPPANWLRTRAPQLATTGQPVLPRQLRPFRFRVTHFWEPDPTKPPVRLYRGTQLIDAKAVTAETLDAAIESIGRYLHYRQNTNGLFSYEYRPATDEYAPVDKKLIDINAEMIRQAGALWALARYARWCGRPDVAEAATRGIRRFDELVMTFPGREDIMFLGRFGARNKLGLTALYSLALIEHSDDGQLDEVRKKFIAGMLMLQQSNGLFADVFPPATPSNDVESQMYYPGEALLAMARWHERVGGRDSPVPDVFAQAFEPYRKVFRNFPDPAFVPWQSQAFSVMARLTRNNEYAAFVFEMTDWLSEKQLSEENCPWPELRGGVAAYVPGRVGVSTAVYLEGFTDALALARQRGDRRRSTRYEAVVRAAARYVLQLMVRPEECYYIGTPKDAVGGIRTTLTNHRLRIDHVQHALFALIKSREVLFGKRGPRQ